MAGRRRRFGVTIAALALGFAAFAAEARELADVFRSPLLAGLQLAPLGDALASTVALTYPVASASSSFTFTFDPELGTFERRTIVLGPVLGERAETIGPGQIDVAFSYAHVALQTIDGRDLDGLRNRPRVGNRVVSFHYPRGVELEDGRFTSFLPVDVRLGIDVDADIFTPGITYGVTRDLDVNLTVPLVRTALDVTTRTRVPDPRLPQFALSSGAPEAGTTTRTDGDGAFGVGDVLLRAKYMMVRDAPLDVALGLGLSLPSGRTGDFHGTGRVRVQPLLILSRVLWSRVEPLLDLGADIDADDVDRTSLLWATGVTAQLARPLSGFLVFLGRHELGVQGDRVALPFFFQIERNDVIDASVGLRLRFTEAGFVAASALLPLSADGLRPDVVPFLAVEYAFSTSRRDP